ncbi:BlaI/MecI/CopY family transcriptional regulator [Streptomyces sp. NBC_00638]|uniref:BlaI/MecI/CopY family transcriptional regulator n=1 Tax=unclassified Streptomyces TaxID=2593676 RepID=UPI00224FFCF6|nr:BlaI/MecI/CopY family transcriptional regulator [Streptomyces sp. NBC_00638]MCX5007813.1 BlaI/MecI/CopY family transcriptional regulator [Streptomyces sp. NBC_00638]
MAHRDREDRPRRHRRRGQGELEVQVLAALRGSEVPVTAAWVQERLDGDLAYTTVVTILTRLLAKDAVARERRGRSFVWTPTADAAGLAALKMRRLLDGEHDREAVLASFVTALSPDDERVLRALLEAAPAAEVTRANGAAGRGGATRGSDEPGVPRGAAGGTED